MNKGIYIGSDSRLKGKTALLQETEVGYMTQFDDTTLLEGFGWSPFFKNDFTIIEEDPRNSLEKGRGFY